MKATHTKITVFWKDDTKLRIDNVDSANLDASIPGFAFILEADGTERYINRKEVYSFMVQREVKNDRGN